jgi:hypothetical protein
VRKIRKRPVVVEAVRLMDPATPEEVAAWCSGTACDDGSKYKWVEVETLEGTHRADYGDWIIKGVKGEFYPCKHDILEMTYDFL